MTQQNDISAPDQKSSAPSFVIHEQVKLLYMQAPVSNSVAIIISLLYYFLLEPRVDSKLLFYWLVSMLLTASYRLFLWYRRKNSPESRTATSWLNHYLIGCGLVGVSWSLIYPFVFITNDPFIFASLAILAFGVISSALTILSPYLPAFIVYTYPQAILFSLSLLSDYYWLMLAVGIYMVMMTLFARNANSTILQSIKLQEGNSSLIRDLNNEVNKRELLIAQRTLELEQKNNDLITEVKEKEYAQSRLQQANTDLAATLQAIPDLLFEVDEKGVYIDLWAQDTELLAAQKEVLIGNTVTEMLPKKAAHSALEAIRLAAESGTSHGQIYSLQLEQGERWFELSTSRKPTQDGSNHFMVIARDITDKKLIETELEQYREQLEEKVAQRTRELITAKDHAESLSRIKTQFLANMSHEIRTPMNAVLGLAQIGERGIPPEKVQKTFQQIRNSGQHLLEVINDILDFSKIEAGKLTVESRPFMLKDIVQSVVELLSDRIKVSNLKLTTNIDKNIPDSFLGDSRRLQQVLINLLSNAIKFTPKGEVSLTVKGDEKIIRFLIKDSGIGMNQEEVSRLFSPFEQADNSTTRKYGGTGLGLAISYNLAHLMGGNIDVESQQGTGSLFTLSLPLTSAETANLHIQTVNKSTDLAKKRRLNKVRILAAEDEEINRFILQDLLEYEGASVVFAENGQQVLDQLKQNGASSFDVILMDIQMPIMDGYEATRQVHNISPGLPIIGLTAHALEQEQLKSYAAGMLDHITKPVDADILIAAILRHIQT